MTTRVLVVDDSAFARKVFRDVFSTAHDMEVVSSARDGLEALEEISSLKPDVITLDLMMPNLDGLGLLKQLSPEERRRVVVVSVSDKDSEPAVRALQLGAFDVVTKPTAMATDLLATVGGQLLEVVRRCAEAERGRRTAPSPPALHPAPPPGAVELVVIGASTGGPAAVTRLLPQLPADFPAPVVVALHIPAGYTGALAQRLDDVCALRVSEAVQGGALYPGTITIAPGGSHLFVERVGDRLLTRVRPPPEDAFFAPSVDVLFDSASSAAGPSLVAVVLTGMGEDGFVGAKAVAARGGTIVTEAASSCVVYGMPRVVAEAGLSSAIAPIERMAATLTALTRPPR